MWEDKDFQSHLKRIYSQTKSVKEFLASALLPITDLNLSTHGVDRPSIQIPTPQSFSSQTLSCPDPAPLPFSTSVSASASSSSLPLALLVAATRLAALFDPGSEGVTAQGLATNLETLHRRCIPDLPRTHHQSHNLRPHAS